MQEVFEKIINKLEEQKEYYKDIRKNTHCRVTETSECDSCRADHYLDARLRCVDDIIEIVKQEAEQYNNGWIPVSERLPNEAYGCLVTVMDCEPSTQTEFENILPYFVGYDGETWNDADGEEIPFEVIAWQRLPLPFKDKE